jgi:hypothetical protein
MARVELYWNPFDQADPGPLIDVSVMNSRHVIEAGRAIGFEYPKPLPMKALLDTGASVTVVSKVWANNCKLFQTSEGSQIVSLGDIQHCGEHAGALSFPGSDLTPLDPIRIVSAVFKKERFHAVIIGRDILRNWVITFDGRSKRVTITD